MIVSVILSTYNHPKWLQKSLAGYAAQTRQPDQILIADDGSGTETEKVIREFQNSSGIPLIHVWHPDNGFRKCTILNRAIENADGNYLIFSDGDCIPREDFVATHCRLARPGRFLSGGMLRLQKSISQTICESSINTGKPFSPNWLLKNGAKIKRQMKLLSLFGRAAELVDRLTSTRPTFNGHNASAWKRDIMWVNGFDERMRYGGLDRELGERLENANVSGLQVRHRAVCVHLHHGRPYLDQAALQRNQQIRKETAINRATQTPLGIKQRGHGQDSLVLETRMRPSEHAALSEAIHTATNQTVKTQDKQRINSDNESVEA